MSELLELEQQHADYKTVIARRQMAMRLANNRDFKKLILEDFCVTECARFAQISGDFNMPKDNRDDALATAQAAGHLKRYLQAVTQMGAMAERDLGALEEELDSARAAEADDNNLPLESEEV
jgi:hypothetical protein